MDVYRTALLTGIAKAKTGLLTFPSKTYFALTEAAHQLSDVRYEAEGTTGSFFSLPSHLWVCWFLFLNVLQIPCLLLRRSSLVSSCSASLTRVTTMVFPIRLPGYMPQLSNSVHLPSPDSLLVLGILLVSPPPTTTTTTCQKIVFLGKMVPFMVMFKPEPHKSSLVLLFLSLFAHSTPARADNSTSETRPHLYASYYCDPFHLSSPSSVWKTVSFRTKLELCWLYSHNVI